MKNIFQIVPQFALFALLSFSAMATDKDPVASIVVEHWPPWEIAYDANNQIVEGGMAIEIIQEIFSRLQIKFRLITAPWKRALSMIEIGKADLIPMILKSQEREKYILFTIPVYEEERLFLYSKEKFNDFKWDKWEDLKPFLIGTTRGYAYGEFDKAIKEHQLRTDEVTTDKQNILKLIKGRIDLTPIYFVNALGLFEEVPNHQYLSFADKAIELSVFRFGISKKSFLAKKAKRINKAILEMRKDGTFKKILGEYYR